MSQGKRTLLLWLVLIVLFVAFYQFFSVPRPEAAPRVECETSLSQVLMNWLVPALMFVGIVVWIRWQQRQFAGGHEGVKLMNQGRNLQALEVFQREREKNPKGPANVFNCGVVELALWRLDAAMKNLEASKQLKGPGEGQVAVLFAEHFPLACALVGRTEEGFRALEGLPKEVSASRIKLSRGALLVRRGEWQAARAELNSLEVKQLGGTFGALARAMDAMCIEALTGEKRHVDRVGIFAEASTDEARRHWPEFVQFVERAPAW